MVDIFTILKKSSIRDNFTTLCKESVVKALVRLGGKGEHDLQLCARFADLGGRGTVQGKVCEFSVELRHAHTHDRRICVAWLCLWSWAAGLSTPGRGGTCCHRLANPRGRAVGVSLTPRRGLRGAACTLLRPPRPPASEEGGARLRLAERAPPYLR